jgi:hypothetical protein
MSWATLTELGWCEIRGNFDGSNKHRFCGKHPPEEVGRYLIERTAKPAQAVNSPSVIK